MIHAIINTLATLAVGFIKKFFSFFEVKGYLNIVIQ
jgi:hypothetical protein